MGKKLGARPKQRAEARRTLVEPFAWLLKLGFELAEREAPSVVFRSGRLFVAVSYYWQDEVPSVDLAKRLADRLIDQLPGTQVRLAELVRFHIPDAIPWASTTEGRGGRPLSVQLAQAADLLRTHAAGLFDGTDPDLLDRVIAARRRHGIPGYDTPWSEPWRIGAEGGWHIKDPKPIDVATAIANSRDGDTVARATAALQLVISARIEHDTQTSVDAHCRLHQLLVDDEADVRCAAASALAEWGDTDAIPVVLELLEAEPGDRPSAMAWAATILTCRAIHFKEPTAPYPEDVLDALWRFGRRGVPAAEQMRQLTWRLGAGTPPDLIR